MAALVGYATAHGSTRGIAERIAARLGEHRHRAEARPVDQVRDISGYDAVVLGSAVHNQAWLPAAVEFVRRHRDSLAHRPVWLFSVGARDCLSGPLGGWLAAHYRDPREITGIRERIHPRDHRVFTGVVDRDHYPLLGRAVLTLLGGRYGDFRDWKDINAWAESIARDLASRPPEGTRAGARDESPR